VTGWTHQHHLIADPKSCNTRTCTDALEAAHRALLWYRDTSVALRLCGQNQRPGLSVLEGLQGDAGSIIAAAGLEVRLCALRHALPRLSFSCARPSHKSIQLQGAGVAFVRAELARLVALGQAWRYVRPQNRF